MNDTTRKLDKTKLGRERRNDLDDRIRTINGVAWGRDEDDKDPPEIAKARAAVARFDDGRRRRNDARSTAIRIAAAKARRELLGTDDYEAGIAIVEKLEAEARRRRWVKAEGE